MLVSVPCDHIINLSDVRISEMFVIFLVLLFSDLKLVLNSFQDSPTNWCVRFEHTLVARLSCDHRLLLRDLTNGVVLLVNNSLFNTLHKKEISDDA